MTLTVLLHSSTLSAALEGMTSADVGQLQQGYKAAL
jgi:hypothetical protein